MERIIKKYIDFNDDDLVVDVGGTVPGDMIVDGAVVITTAFTAGSVVMDLGFAADNQGGSADPNALGSAMVMTSAAQLRIDELAASTNKLCTVADRIQARVTSGSAITAGEAYVWLKVVNFNPLND